jgi:sugar phosphate isomerase/epimerase
MSKAIRGSAYLGAKAMVLHPLMPFGANEPTNPSEVLEINLEFMSSLSEVAGEYGITVCYENMPFLNHPIHSAREVTDLVRKVNSNNFKVCLDTGHCIRCGEDLTDAVKYIGKDLLFAMHVHDNDGLHDRHWMPKMGIGDWKGFSGALADIGFDGVFSLETSASSKKDEDNVEKIERELAALASSLARITQS